jgi:hypothetical protein
MRRTSTKGIQTNPEYSKFTRHRHSGFNKDTSKSGIFDMNFMMPLSKKDNKKLKEESNAD